MKITIDLGLSRPQGHQRLYALDHERATRVFLEVLEVQKRIGEFEKFVKVISVYPYPAVEEWDRRLWDPTYRTTMLCGKVVVEMAGDREYVEEFVADTAIAGSVRSAIAGALFDAHTKMESHYRTSLTEMERVSSPLLGMVS